MHGFGRSCNGNFCSRNKVVTNCQNTVQGFKRFHGRAFSDPYVQAAKSSLVFDLAQMPTGSTGIKVRLIKPQWSGQIVVTCVFQQLLRSVVWFRCGYFTVLSAVRLRRSCIWRRRRCSALSRSLPCCCPNWRRPLKLRSRNPWQTASSLYACSL